ncbi:MAG: nucleotidyltransferase domain-containing protein [Candidatus Kapaibacterium sp.]
MDSESIINRIKEKLMQARLHKIILFGSHSIGSADSDSDIDLLVVTSDKFIPKNFKEKSELMLKIAKLIAEEKRQHPIDLLVYTLPMYQKFIEQDSAFSREIRTKGKTLYEAGH